MKSESSTCIKLLAIIVFTFISIQSYCQIIFEHGYFVNESDKKTECLIKNVDWYNNPTSFKYKLTEDGPVKDANIQSVKEFGVGDGIRFIRARVKMDRSSNNINEMSVERNPEFQEELLYLKVLIDGKASLYMYTNGDLKRFFYKMDESEINQLVYKQYLEGVGYAHNNTFRQQLFVDFKCKLMEKEDFSSLNYDKNELIRLFIKFNTCSNSSYTRYELKQKRDLFNLSLRPGINFSSLSIENPYSHLKSTDFDGIINFRFGVEAEIVFPFNKSKWSLLLEPTYQSYKTEKDANLSDVNTAMSYHSRVDYQSVEVPVGIRHSFFLSDDFKIFVNASYIIDFDFNSTLEFTRISDGAVSEIIELNTGGSQAFGAGFKFKDRYGMEIRYHTKREILNNRGSWDSKYNKTSIIFVYTLF